MKTVAIIAIGDELLNGFTVDTNSHWLKERLRDFSLSISRAVNVPDNEELIISELEFCIRNNIDYVFISGGLGPTHDDITKHTLSVFFKLPIVINDSHLNQIKKKFSKKKNERNMNSSTHSMLSSQAEILDSFKPIPNDIGTALGMAGEYANSFFFVLPGVPKEYKDMIANHIIPYYISNEPTSNPSITVKTSGITESYLFNMIKEIIYNNKKRFKFSILPHFTGVNIRIIQIDNNFCLDDIRKELLKKIGKFYYGYNNDSLDKVVSKLMLKHKLTISIAESCTGGLISKQLTDNPGSSNFIAGGVVAYSNEIKNKILQVPQSILKKYGAVSSNVAELMANNVANLYETDIGLSITGIAGPTGGSDDKPIGLYYVGIFIKGHFFSEMYQSKINDRKINREISSIAALNLLRLKIKENYE
tara:strand:- start:420 stop:1676 length:1257 start_codon:yes stop_codon:yes gene_type:complete